MFTRLLQNNRRFPAALILAALLSSPLAALAAGPVQVSATILVSCQVAGTVLSFGGALNPLTTGSAVDASSTLTVTCTNTTPFSLSLNAGLNAGGPSNFGGRVMKSGANSLAYQLYLDAARSTVWGDGSGSGIYNGTGTGSSQAIALYGRLPSLAQVAPGSYSDTVTVTVSY